MLRTWDSSSIGGRGQFLPVYFSLQGFRGLNDLIKRRWFFEYHFLHRFVVTLQLGLDFPVRKQFKRLRVTSQIVSSPTLAIEYSFVIGYFRKKLQVRYRPPGKSFVYQLIDIVVVSRIPWRYSFWGFKEMKLVKNRYFFPEGSFRL